MLVLKEFKLDENAELFLSIKGREEGIIAWLLSRIGFDPIVSLTCSRNEVMFKSSSTRKGQLNVNIPTTAVTAVVTGYKKPFSLLVLAVIFIIGGLYMQNTTRASFFVPGLIAAVICLVAYMLQKTMIFSVFNGGDTAIASLTTKRSVIEGVNVDFDKFEKAAALLNKVVVESTAGLRRS